MENTFTITTWKTFISFIFVLLLSNFHSSAGLLVLETLVWSKVFYNFSLGKVKHNFRYPLELSTFLKAHWSMCLLSFSAVLHLCLYSFSPLPQYILIWRLNIMFCTRYHQMDNEELNSYKCRFSWGSQWTCWLTVWRISLSQVWTAKDNLIALCSTLSWDVQLKSYTPIKRKCPKPISLVSQPSQFLNLTFVTYRQQGAIPTAVLSWAQRVQKTGKEKGAMDLRC